ncbi:MAG: flagellar biosynthetic protein FliR [Candidatus Margulisbacteria bacterium]|nr:flagellar biosynthetic protein FliR [Candidatus Margulisiibacteriota bacterium]
MISTAQLTVFLLILARISGVFIQAPVFSSRNVPFYIKTAIAVWLSLILWFVVPISPLLPTGVVSLIFALTFETAFGFLIGFVCSIIFLAIQSAGEIMDLQMGLSVASALDPVFGSVISIIGRMTFMLALIIFINANGHHLILSAFYESFSILPAGTVANFTSSKLAMQLINLGASFWATAIILSAPIVLLIFLSDFAFGIVSRVAPQVNVFMLGFQVKPMLGLLGISLCLPFIASYIDKMIELIMGQVLLLSKILVG